MENKSDKDWLVTLLLCISVGYIGIHRFYAGKIGTGILIMIITGKFTDSEGRLIENK